MSSTVDPTAGASGAGGVQVSDNMDLDTIFMLLALERSETMDQVISDMAADMKNTNERINKLNEAMSAIRSARPGGKADESQSVDWTAELSIAYQTLEEEGVSMPDSLKFEDNGTKIKGKPGAFDAWIENVKTKVDSLSSNSQLDMIKLQGMINKRNQTIEMASNVMQKIASSLNNLIANLR